MAKTESTAVNALIELVQSGNSAQPEGAAHEELFVTAPKKVSPPRMTSTITGAGEVAPLPRRVPQGTQQTPVRVTTAPPARAASIPPIPQPAAEPDDSMIKTTPSLGPVVRQATNPNLNPKATLLGAGSAQLDRSQLPPLPPPKDPKATLMGQGSAEIDRSQLPPLPAPVGTSTIMGHASVLDPSVPAPPRATLPPPRPSAQMATQRPSTPPPPTPAVRPSAPPMPVVPAPISAAMSAPPMPYPSAQPYMQHLAPDMTSNQAWFDEAAVDAMEPIEHDIGTAQITKQSSWKLILPKLIMPMVILVIVGIFVGGYFAFDGDGGQKPKTAKVVAPAAEAKAEPAVAPESAKAVEPAKEESTAEPAKEEPVAKAEPQVKTEEPKAEEPKAEEPKAEVKPEAAKTEVTPPNLVGTNNEPVKTAAKPGAFVDVKIESEPSKATVMIVDRGKTSFLGPTPIVASLDPSREYDIVFTYPNKPTQLEHIAPAKVSHLKVKLGKAGNQAKAEKKVDVVVAKTEKPKTEVKVAKKIEKPKTEVKVEKKPPFAEAFETEKPPPGSSLVGEGVLMISSKPPCEIVIDGVPTGLTTPQRAIKLAAGKHKITLVNTTEKIKKTIAVEIIADQPTKVIQNLMQ